MFEFLNLIKIKNGVIPVCSYCNMVRGDDGKWKKIDEDILDIFKRDLSHGICSECAEKHYNYIVAA